jgi:hypothetical protein
MAASNALASSQRSPVRRVVNAEAKPVTAIHFVQQFRDAYARRHGLDSNRKGSSFGRGGCLDRR